MSKINSSSKSKNPFYSDKQGTATHLSTWNMEDVDKTKFQWLKNDYKIISEYEYEINMVHIDIYYKNSHVKKLNKTLFAQNPTIENITRTTQQAITEYLESW